MKGITDALTVAGDGYRVLPVGQDKVPLIKDWPRLATTDPDTVKGWWKRFPEALVGIATGDRLLVIDLDTKNNHDGPTEWRTWCAENNVPPMEQHWQRTKSVGGRHLYLLKTCPAGNRGGLFPGVDIRGDGGYVVAWNRPPALADLPAAPAKVEALLSRPEEHDRPDPGPIGPDRAPALGVHPYAAAAIKGELADLDALKEPGSVLWNTTCNTAGWKLRGLALAWWSGYSPGQDEADFMEHAPRDDKGFGQPALRKIWTSVVEGHERDGNLGRPLPEGCDPYEPARDLDADPSNDFQPYISDELADILGVEPVAVERKSPTTNSNGWRPVDLAGYADGTYQPPEAKLMLRDDDVALLYPGMTHSIHGESESGKSMLVQHEVAEQIKAGNLVMLLDYEADPGSVVERLMLMGCSADDLSRLTYVQPEADHEYSPASVGAFEALLRQRYALVIIDGVNEALAQAPAKARSTGGLGGNDDITAWHDRLPRRIARVTGAAVVLIDHVAKGADAGRFAIGGQAKMATISGAAYLVKPRTPLGRGLVGEIDLYVAKDRHGYVRSHAVGTYSTDRMQLVTVVRVDGTNDRIVVDLLTPLQPRTADDRLQRMQGLVADFLTGLPDDHEGAGVALVKSSVTGNDTLIADALKELVSTGYVDVRIVGQRKLHKMAKPYIPELA